MSGKQVCRVLDLGGGCLPDEVDVDLAGGGGVGVTEDHLDDFDRDAAGEQQ